MYLAAEGEELKFSGAAVRIAFEEPFYVGIGVCAHNKDVVEKAVFSNVELTTTLAGPDEAGAVQHARDAVDRLDRPPRRPRHARRGSRPPTGCATARR